MSQRGKYGTRSKENLGHALAAFRSVFVLQFRDMVYLTEMHKITILQMIGYGNRTRTQAEVVRLFQEKYTEFATPPLVGGAAS
ncbi:hypothetical protein NQ318_012622 [Aromia moschata]|uniref:Uncharacterized protein n=1 Tax=Aromia moschata TaxID=1265417 RepID=A0AAV8XG37_9CUCU|nr:hypothetical protein NQ318_012622 [Aromia moschata]